MTTKVLLGKLVVMLSIDDWDALKEGRNLPLPEGAQRISMSPELLDHLLETGEVKR